MHSLLPSPPLGDALCPTPPPFRRPLTVRQKNSFVSVFIGYILLALALYRPQLSALSEPP